MVKALPQAPSSSDLWMTYLLNAYEPPDVFVSVYGCQDDCGVECNPVRICGETQPSSVGCRRRTHCFHRLIHVPSGRRSLHRRSLGYSTNRTRFRPTLPWLPTGTFRDMGLLFSFLHVSLLEAIVIKDPERLSMAFPLGHCDHARHRVLQICWRETQGEKKNQGQSQRRKVCAHADSMQQVPSRHSPRHQNYRTIWNKLCCRKLGQKVEETQPASWRRKRSCTIRGEPFWWTPCLMWEGQIAKAPWRLLQSRIFFFFENCMWDLFRFCIHAEYIHWSMSGVGRKLAVGSSHFTSSTKGEKEELRLCQCKYRHSKLGMFPIFWQYDFFQFLPPWACNLYW